MARTLDAEFERFTMPKVAEWPGTESTPSNIVLGTDDAIIRLSELGMYEEILAKAREKSRPLRMLVHSMDRVNREIWRIFMDTKIVYRGMKISEFSIIAKMGGIVGLHRKKRYAACNDFVSCSIDANEAALFLTGKEESGIVVEMDVSRMKRSDYAQVTYEARRHIRVTDGGRHVYNPYEMFDGSHTGAFISAREIQLRNGSKPIVRSVVVPEARPAGFFKRLNKAVMTLEASQGQEIRIKYTEAQQ